MKTDGSVELLLPPPETPEAAVDQAQRLRELVQTLLERNEQLQHALDSRVVIEQAKGVLAERYALTLDDAFDLLRRSARNHRLRLHVLATAVVASRETPTQIRPPDQAA